MTEPSIREQILEIVRSNREGGNREAPGQILQVHRIKAQAVVKQFEDRVDKNNPLNVEVRGGSITIYKVQFGQFETSSFVDVWTSPDVDEEPHYRFFNPPTLAQDSQGTIEIEGRKYREDPLAAVAEVILGAKS